jgi:hypothetical protein
MEMISLTSRAYGFSAMLSAVQKFGELESTRLGPAWELRDCTMYMNIGELFYRPGMARALGWLESLSVLAGIKMPEDQLMLVAPRLKYEYDDSAQYGPKVHGQLVNVVRILNKRPNTRRAIVHVGKPSDGGDVDKPCIDSYVFNIREDRLHVTMFVRSWDLVYGFIYDTMVASMLGLAVAEALKLVPGRLTAFAVSAHVYRKDVEAIPECNEAGIFSIMANHPELTPEEILRSRMAWARDLAIDVMAWTRGVPLGIVR